MPHNPSVHPAVFGRAEAPDLPVPMLPAFRGSLQHGGPGAASHDRFLQYWVAIRRFIWPIAIFTAAVAVVAMLIVFRIPNEYESVAVIRLDPQMPDSVTTAGPSSEPQGGPAMDAQLATDQDELLSRAVYYPTLEKLGLRAGPDVGPGGFLAGVKTPVRVIRPPGTYLLEIHARALTPPGAQQLANTLGAEFIEHEFTTRSDALKDLSGYMKSQLDELRARVERSQTALDTFLRTSNIPDPDAKYNQQEQQLQELTTELDNARAKQRALHTQLSLIGEGNLDALLVSDRSPQLTNLVTAQQNAEVQFTNIQAQFGPASYVYKQQQRQLDRIAGLISDEEKNIADQIQDEATEQDAQVDVAQTAFDAAYTALQAANERAVQYSILKGDATSDQAVYNDLLTRLNAADVSAGYHSNALRIVDVARANPVPVYPHVLLTVALAALLALCLGVGCVVTLTSLDQTFTSPEAVTLATGETVLGSLPTLNNGQRDSLIASAQEGGRRSAYAEAVLGLRTNLLFNFAAKAQAIMVCSSLPQEGKSTTAANLAAAYAALGHRTVLLDMDIRRPQVHRTFGIANRVGLSSVLRQQVKAAAAIVPSGIENLGLLPAGPSVVNPTELLAVNIGSVLEELKAEYDCIIVDTPPVLYFADSRTIAATVDGCVLVVRAGVTPRTVVITAVNELRNVRARLSGIVLNAIDQKMSYYYHHHYYYDYSRYTSGEELVPADGAEGAADAAAAGSGGRGGKA